MHMQPFYRMNPFVTRYGNGRGKTDAYTDGRIGAALGKDELLLDVGADIFERGLCLPSDNKMSKADMDKVCEIEKRCFG